MKNLMKKAYIFRLNDKQLNMLDDLKFKFQR